MQRRLRSSIVWLLLLALVLAAAAPAVAQDDTSAPPQPLILFTQFPAQTIGLNETVTVPLVVRAGAPQTVRLSVEGVPEGWDASFRGGNRTVSAVFADGREDATVDLRLEPAAVEPGSVYTLTVVAQGRNETARLPVELAVEEKAPPRLTLTTDLPAVRGQADTTFRFNVTLKNEGSDDLDVTLSADAPPAFFVNFTLSGQDVTSVPLAGGESERLTVEVEPLNDMSAGVYPLQVSAQAADASATLDLAAEVVGRPELVFTTPDGRLSAEASAGQDTTLRLVVANSGTAPARNVTLSSTAPSGWTVTLDPEEISELLPGRPVDVTATLRPADNTINGDYVTNFTARADAAATKNVEMRITVTTSTMWGIAGVALIALAVGVVALAVGRFGRR